MSRPTNNTEPVKLTTKNKRIRNKNGVMQVAEDHDEEKRGKGKCPEVNAGLLSKVTFWWMNSTVAMGSRKVLEQSDLMSLRPEEEASEIAERFQHEWDNQQTKPSLLKTLHLVYGRRFYMAGLLQLAYNFTQLAAPYFSKLIIQYVGRRRTPYWVGIAYAVVLLLIGLLGSVLHNSYMFIVVTQGMRVKTGLRTAVYRKTLKLSSQARAKFNTGDIVNYMGVETQKIGELIPFLHQIWSSAFSITVSLCFLFYFLGYPAVAGLIVVAILLPVQGASAKFMHKYKKRLLQQSGERIKLINEILKGIRVIKYYAWEDSFLKRAFGYRAQELVQVRMIMFVNTIFSVLMTLAPLIVSVMSFSFYGLVGKVLNPAIIFPALSYFNLLRMPLAALPNMTARVAESRVSLQKIQEFLLAEEIVMPEPGTDTAHPVRISSGEFTWNVVDEQPNDSETQGSVPSSKYQKFTDETDAVEEELSEVDDVTRKQSSSTLRNINIDFKKGSLNAIVGLVGSGKSSFLSAIIGEMKQIKGSTIVSSTIAYCPQQPWIQNCTARDNITFGQPFNEVRYRETIKACALEHDFEVLPAGDLTEIGENGINLSGGQRQRISLARAVYLNADTYLLDDVLSAVDAHVGRSIFDNCIKGVLKNKTILLVTNQWQFLQHCDRIIVLQDGTISENGSYDELSGGEFSQMLQSFASQEIHEEKSDKEETEDEEILVLEDHSDRQEAKAPKSEKKKGRLMQAEERQTGNIKIDVYRSYSKYAGGHLYTLFVLSLYVVTQALVIGNSYWLAYWSNSTRFPNPKARSMTFYLGIYLAFGVAAGLLSFVREILFSIGGIWAASRLHDTALRNIAFAPTKFFDSTPIGRIINRFSKDISTIDDPLVASFKQFLGNLIQFFGIFVLVSYVTPYFLIPGIPVLISYFLLQRYYRKTSRELKRLESISRSPVYAHFSETLSGISTIRAYSVQERFLRENELKLDDNNIPHFYQSSSQRWLSLRLETISSVMLFCSALFCVIGRDLKGFAHVDPALAGLALSYSLQVTQTMNWVIRLFTETEASMSSVERVLHYSNGIEQEATTNLINPDDEWPMSGNITFDNVHLKYREDLDYVLKGLSAQIYGAEKIGIVGRTGAGKSSLMTALFRLVELDQGSIVIDDIDVGNVSLFNLRSRLAIIPQDPVLFSGTVRFNLDPFERYSDKEIWQVLERSHIKQVIEDLPLQLSNEVSEGGLNFSVGQRQLICLARAILRETKVLILDEATASVDLSTDALIQQTVRTEFADRTVLTIAHRLNTIIDSDRIMVLDQGKLVEFDAPKKLLEDDNSLFTQLCKKTGNQNYEYLKELALHA